MGCCESKDHHQPDPFSNDRFTSLTNERLRLPESAVLTPEDSKFSTSQNGRNGYKVFDVYESDQQLVRWGNRSLYRSLHGKHHLYSRRCCCDNQLGKGNFGMVFKAKHLKGDTNRPQVWNKVAIKETKPTVLDKLSGPLNTYDQLEKHCQEIKTLLRLRKDTSAKHSPVLYLFEYFWNYSSDDSSGKLFLVTELLGLELGQWLQQQHVLKESAAKQISQTIINALIFMHDRGVVNRDIKLQNVLFRRNGDLESLKVVDFGLAKVLDGTLATDFCGSPGYISPEMYQSQPYGYEVDMFAMGVIIFRLLSGMRPFASTNKQKCQSDTIHLRYKIQGNVWERVSPEAVKIVRKLLIGREERLTAEQAINHEWFNTDGESELNPDYTQTDAFRINDSYSKAIVQSHAPLVSQAGSSNRFWLDGKLAVPIRIILRSGLYAGRILEEQQGELICVEEVPLPSMMTLPAYVAGLDFYNEQKCRRICREAALIVQILHNNDMAHRNIHVNNFVVDRNGKLLILGLSNAQVVQDNQPLTGHFGYLYDWYAFKAPEIDSDFFHDKTVDIWSLGAFIYMMLTALPPFRGDGAQLIANKHNGKVVFDTVLPSHPAQRLVRSLLQVNPSDRPTIEQVLEDEWMIESDYVLVGNDLSLAQDILSDWEHRPIR